MFPTRIYLTGFMGSGKSTIGPRVARALGHAFIDLDDVIAARAGRPVQVLFAEVGEAAFRRLEQACLRETVRRTEAVIALGGGALASEENLQVALAHGTVVYLHVAPAELARRLQQSGTTRPLLLGEDGRLLSEVALRQKIETLLAHREAFYRRAHVTVDTTGLSAGEAAAAVVEALRHQESRKERR